MDGASGTIEPVARLRQEVVAGSLLWDSTKNQLITWGGAGFNIMWNNDVSIMDLTQPNPEWQVLPGVQGTGPAIFWGFCAFWLPHKRSMYVVFGRTPFQSDMGTTLYRFETNISVWFALPAAIVPSDRMGVSIAMVEAGEYILFGGGLLTSSFDDTWILAVQPLAQDVQNEYTWVRLHPDNTPPPRRHSGAVFHKSAMYIFFGLRDLVT